MAMSIPAEIEAFLALSSYVKVTYLDDDGRSCAAETAKMVRLSRAAPRSSGGEGLLTIRVDAKESEPVIARLLEDRSVRVLS